MKPVKVSAVCLLTALVLSTSAASASAHEFVASKAGTVKGTKVNNQKFKTAAGITECTKLTSEGKAIAGGQKANIEKIKYSSCDAFGFEAFVSEAEFEFSAEEWVTVKNSVTIEVPGVECTIRVEPTKNKELKTVTYKNSAPVKTLEIKAVVKGLTYISSGGMCGESGENGEYSGDSKLELVGGTLEWKL